jgi:hypothetical protein
MLDFVAEHTSLKNRECFLSLKLEDLTRHALLKQYCMHLIRVRIDLREDLWIV